MSQLARPLVSFLMITLLSSAPPCVAKPLIRYDFPADLPASGVYRTLVEGEPVSALQTKRGAILNFGMAGPVEVRVNLPRAPKEIVIRPLSAGITAMPDDAGFRFTLPRPMNLSVEIDGNLEDPLLVFANPEIDAPDRSDPKVRFFEAGRIHDAGEILLGDGETLYLEGGAVVRGVVRARNATHVSIRGAGILDSSTRTHKTNKLVLRECRDAVIENTILLDPLGWTMHLSACERVRVSNTRVIGWRANSDGLDIEYSKHVRVDGCFWRTADDCIAIKAIYPPGVMNVPFEEMINPETLAGHPDRRIPGDSMGDIEIRNCVLWNERGGQGFEIGFELRIDHIRDIVFRDSDIIHVNGGAFSIHNGDRAVIENFLVENVRIENPDRFIDFHVGLSIYSDDCPPPYRRSNPKRLPPPDGFRPERANNPWQWYVPAQADTEKHAAKRGLIRNVILRNIQMLKTPRAGSILYGYSEGRGIADVLLEGITIEGQPVMAADEIDLYQRHVRNLEFRPAR